MNSKNVWLVEDEADGVTGFRNAMSCSGYAVQKYSLAQVIEEPLDSAGATTPSLIVLSVANAGSAALSFLAAVRRVNPPIPVVILVSPDQARIVVEAVKLGASDALVLPVDPQALIAAMEQAWRKEQYVVRSAGVVEFSNRVASEHQAFASRSPRMTHIWEVARTVARANVPVLILGESGVGKEVLARFVHRQSPRAGKPLIKVNCAALPHDLLESELFGYERGAFTGAVNEKPGKFELADQGCIILDEIGEMPRDLQAKLLHILEDGEFCRLGGKRPIKIDVRVLALTNRRLEEAVPRGEFRDDLYFRLNVIKINIPPLRERREDIPLLCDYFLEKHRDALGSSLRALPAELVDAFARYDWPGNVRQLENTMKRYLILPELDMELNATIAAPGGIVAAPRAAHAAAAAAVVVSMPTRRPVHLPGPEESVCLKTVSSMAAERAEREMVSYVLNQTSGNRRQAARRLNICYKALLNKLKKWQIPAGNQTL